MMRTKILLFLLSVGILFSCQNHNAKTNNTDNSDTLLSGKVIVFNAGSLSYIFRILKTKFEEEHPDAEILLEGAGSLTCARKIIDLKKDCDIFASADYKIIDDMIIPEFAEINKVFASNEIVIAYNKKSRYSAEINNKNWFEILLKSDVIFARPNPDNDPCGYRTVMTWQLAEEYYSKNNIEDNLLNKDIDFIRPKAIDLIPLLEIGSVDYVFEYKSIAKQHGFKYIELPEEINLSSTRFAETYKKAKVEVKGKTPGETITFYGEPIIYGVTLLKQGKKNKVAKAFLEYILSEEGSRIILESGFKSI